MVRYPNERLGCEFFFSHEGVLGFYFSGNLLDYTIEGGHFTWSNTENPPSMSHLAYSWSPEIGASYSRMLIRSFFRFGI